MEAYSGKQFVGIDLHRRRTVSVQTTESGEGSRRRGSSRRDTHQRGRSSRQQRGQRRLVDVPKRRVLTRDDVLHLVAMEAVGP